ncbi:MAG: methyltransferase domain-containing protein [Alphaproteobacteria bacterium]|nr:methyltransferase domain-containing protein [Alphaproteobacteria bacterium]
MTQAPPSPLAASYASWRESPLGQITDRLEQGLVFELAGPLAGRRVLDVGCGDGSLARAMATAGAAVTGLDSDPAQLAEARRLGGAGEWVEGHAETLPFPDASFDLVTAISVLCFVADAKAAIAEMARVLKPGGRLVIGELGRRSLWAFSRRLRGLLGSPLWRQARFWTVDELTDIAKEAGLDVTATRGAIFYPPVAALARLMGGTDPLLGRHTSLGAAFIALAAGKR